MDSAAIGETLNVVVQITAKYLRPGEEFSFKLKEIPGGNLHVVSGELSTDAVSLDEGETFTLQYAVRVPVNHDDFWGPPGFQIVGQLWGSTSSCEERNNELICWSGLFGPIELYSIIGQRGSSSQSAAKNCSLCSDDGLLTIKDLDVSVFGDKATFRVDGSAIESYQVSVFSLSGLMVYESDFQVVRPALSWNLLTLSGQRVPNGTYLYVITIKGANGEIQRSEVKKLAVVR